MVPSRMVLQDSKEANICQSIPLAILHWRIGAIRDIILSGFELDLYSVDERAFCYWYLSQVLFTHDRVIRQLMELVPRGKSDLIGLNSISR